MPGLLVHVPGGAEPAGLRLQPGEFARFGRGVPDCPVEIALHDPAVPRLAGEVRACEDHWQLSNFSSDRSYLVENPEGAGEYFRVAPRRLGAPVPFEFARVVLPTRNKPAAFQVFAPDHAYCEAGQQPQPYGAQTLNPFSMDETATYFLVLVALCEARLRDLSTVAIPTTRQVTERLRAHSSCGHLTEQAVTFHIDYLARNKLRLKHPGRGARLDWKREMVVTVALRFGLVHEDHLTLLPPRPSGPGRTR